MHSRTSVPRFSHFQVDPAPEKHKWIFVPRFEHDLGQEELWMLEGRFWSKHQDQCSVQDQCVHRWLQ